jgi:hypothetical protein
VSDGDTKKLLKNSKTATAATLSAIAYSALLGRD